MLRLQMPSGRALTAGKVLSLMMCVFVAASPGVAKPKKGKGESSGKSKEGGKSKGDGGGKVMYGRAGCGAGSLAFSRDDTVPQLGASTTNSLSTQTFGITSGTSNCVGGRTVVADVEQQVFITANLASLSKEAAQGSGSHLVGLAEVFGCSATVGEPALGRLSQERYDALFITPEPSLVLQNYLHAIRANSVLAKDCTKTAES